MRFTDFESAFAGISDGVRGLRDKYKSQQEKTAEKFINTPGIPFMQPGPVVQRPQPPRVPVGAVEGFRTRVGRTVEASGTMEGYADPGFITNGGVKIMNPAPGPLVEAVDPGNDRIRYGLGVFDEGRVRMYIPDAADGSAASINFSVMKDAGNRAFDDVVTLQRQKASEDGGWTLGLNNINEVRLNGQSVDVQKVVDRLQFQSHVDKIMTVNGAADTPFVTFNPDTRAVGISALEPKGRLTLGTGGGGGAVGGDMVFEVGNTHDGQNPGFSAVNFNGYYDRGEKVFDPQRARWRVGVMPDDRFFVDAWKNGWGGPKQVLVASPNEDTVDVNGTLRISSRYTGWADAELDRSEIVSDVAGRKLLLVPPKKADSAERVVQVMGGMNVNDRIVTPGVTLKPSAGSVGTGALDFNEGRLRLAAPAGADFVVGNGTENRMVMKADGKVGIGVENPNAQLHVAGAVQVGGFVLSPEQDKLIVRRADNAAMIAALAQM